MKISPDKIQKRVRVRILYIHVLVYNADINPCSRQIKTDVHNYNVSGIHIHFNPRSSFCTFYAFLRGGTFFVDTKVT